MTKIFIRTDANKHIGMGHLMRCITIAKQMVNYKCIFLVSDLEAYGIVKSNGFESICLNINYKDFSCLEALKVVNIGKKQNVRAILVDSYYVNKEYLVELKKRFLIACFNARKIFLPANVIINYNVNCNIKLYQKLYQGSYTKLLLGSEYVPLRDEFTSLKPYKVKDNITKITIMTGGTDSYNFMGKFANLICDDPLYYNLQFVFISGKYNTFSEQLVEYAQKKKNVSVIENANNIAELMHESDLVVSAGGTTIYELCAVGVPAIIFSMAHNQKGEAEYLGKMGAIKYIGECTEKGFEEILKEVVYELINEKQERIAISKKMHTIADGYGAVRIANVLGTFCNL